MRDAIAGLLVAVPFLMGASAAPVDRQREVFAFADREISESSGLVVVDGLFSTVNDSGNFGRVFTVDPATGETVGSTDFDADAIDVEALATAPAVAGQAEDMVWVGDIGDNLTRRDSIVVRQVPVGRGRGAADVPAYELVYPDGARDAETLLCDPVTGRLYVASKGLLGGVLYAAPKALTAGVNELTEVGSVLPIATDGAFFPDGRHVVLRDYSRAVIYTIPGLEEVASFALPAQEQGEAIAIDPARPDRVYVSSEGVGSAVLRVDLPADALAAVAAVAASPSPSTSQSSSPSVSPSDRAPTISREDRELPEATTTERSAWPWFLSGWIALGFLVLLLRSMRRPDRR